MIQLPVSITRESLLEHHNEETYLARYTGLPVGKGKFKSPFRTDRHPSCGFYRSHNGRVYLVDYARPEYTVDFVKAAMLYYNLSYREALHAIAEDFMIINSVHERRKVTIRETPIYTSSKRTYIRVKRMEYTDDQSYFWSKYNISKDILSKYKIYALQTVYVNYKKVYEYKAGSGLAFGFYRGHEGEGDDYIEYWRIYFPGRKQYKFVSNWKKEWMQGIMQLRESSPLLVVTKSMKDVMALRSFGFDAIAPNSENLFVPKATLDGLRARFKNIVVLYDNDHAGIRGMAKIRMEHKEFFCMWIPKEYGVKDFSDLVEKYGVEETKKLIEKARVYLKRSLTMMYSKLYYNQTKIARKIFGTNGKSELRDSSE